MSGKAQPQSPEAQARYEAFQDASMRMRELVKKQEQLTSSKTECEMVAGELAQLKAEEPVYKLMGKTLVLQDLGDAKGNVNQRLQMIDRELCVVRPALPLPSPPPARPLPPTHPPRARGHTTPAPPLPASEKLEQMLAEQQKLVATRRGEAIKAQQEAQTAQAAASAGGGAGRAEDE